MFLLCDLWLRFLEGLGMTMDDRACLKIGRVSKLRRCLGNMGIGRMHTLGGVHRTRLPLERRNVGREEDIRVWEMRGGGGN
jgi:hypothetical protein